MNINWLILTDHTAHRDTNSVYGLVRAIHADERCGEIWICTRGNEANSAFFNGNADPAMVVSKVDQDFGFETANAYFEKTDSGFDASRIDVVLIRMPQPVHRPFYAGLQAVFPHSRIINAPTAIIETASKQFLLQVASLCPQPVWCENLQQAIDLSHQFEIVLKPLYSYGGKGILRLSTDAVWKEDERFPISVLKDVVKQVDFPMVAMRFLRNVVQGDKRTVVVNKKIIASALRMPAPGSWMCNVAQGGSASIAEADADELKIESVLTPLLFQKGIIMYGFDTLVDDDGRRVLSEINTLSIGGLMPMEEMSGRPVMRETIDQLYAYVRA